jgi:glycosyltransferase involved in cell wall biosynthesis
VATRLPGIEDMLTDGETGLLVEPEDIHGLRTAIAKFRADAEMATAVATNARESVTRYSWIERADRILDHVVDGPQHGTQEGYSHG